MKKHTTPKLRISRETILKLSKTDLSNVQGGATDGTVCVTRGVGCEPTGIVGCESRQIC